jgi:hypothetical protein
MRVAASMLFLAACSFQEGTPADPGVGGGSTPDAPSCGFSTEIDTCSLASAPQGDLVVSGTLAYDTDSHVLTAGGSPFAVAHARVMTAQGPLELIIANDVHLLPNTQLRATGAVPLGIVAFGSMAIDANALVDVGSGGAGARATCDQGAVVGETHSGGAGGGGGGGFARIGGRGGDGDSDGSGSTGGAGGTALAAVPVGPIGGCGGANGGDGDKSGGAGGAGGGAIYLLARTQLAIASGAVIEAGGAGGGGGAQSGGSVFGSGDAGGGGGGAGGMIVIEAAQIRGAGVLAANGGAGGEGSDSGGAGNRGANALGAMTRAIGGAGGTDNGSDGGDGGAKASPSGANVGPALPGGGGGGGGSVGFVIIKSADSQIAASSPDPS